ncbi:LytR C-terminal domain-containing protein [Aeromicrobium sp. Leaf350]|uniref:LytR C-terminal domain-containing protein n=1 Tax=Aeromicrobium sp. Leaf350 TaxID=2876565 RepID=UPI001E285F97|nr:LytR C-terminal domain-containing protein [Aeromicrobium sp. Leaf350]
MTRTWNLLTSLVAIAVFAGGALIGWNLLTAKADTGGGPTCTERSVATGEPLTPNLVQVNVLNASGRSGLANRVSINLQRYGFLAGTIDNTTSQIPVDHVAIFTDDPEDPMVQLVAQQFQVPPQIVAPDVKIGDGVTVVVGPNYTDLNPAPPTEIAATRDVNVCVPLVEL